jgi:hypothetical protein
MSPAEVSAIVRARLSAQLDEDLVVLDELAETIERLRAPSPDPHTEWMRLPALAFQLERFYTAVEALFVRALSTLDGDVPSGNASHRAILDAAAVAVAGDRPALLSRDGVADALELLSFRQKARHAYATPLVGDRLDALAERARLIRHSLDGSMATLKAWLVRP